MINEKKILFLVDWTDTSEKQIIDLFGYKINAYNWFIYNSTFKYQVIRPRIINRYVENILAVFYILLNRKKFDYIVIWQQMIGFILCIIPGLKLKSKIIITSVLYSPTKNNKSFIRLYLLNRALKKADALLYYSQDMANDVRKNCPEFAHKIYSTYIPIIKETITPNKLNHKPNLNSGTVFAGGRSDRDFEIIVKAFSNSNVPVIIVCPQNYKFKNPELITKNIRILYEISSSEFYSYVNNSFCVVIALKNEFSSCGQLLFSYCMEHGIPIIASDCYGSRDYITNLDNGLIVPIADQKAIFKAYNLLYENNQFRLKLIENSKKTAQKMTFTNYINKIDEIIINENSFNK